MAAQAGVARIICSMWANLVAMISVTVNPSLASSASSSGSKIHTNTQQQERLVRLRRCGCGHTLESGGVRIKEEGQKGVLKPIAGRKREAQGRVPYLL